MNPAQIVDALDLLPRLGFFAGLHPAILSDIASSCIEVAMPAGEYVFRQGDPSDSIYIVSAGRLEVSVERPEGDPVTVAEVGRGQIVGEMGLLTGDPRSASLLSLRDSLLFRLSKDRFDQLIDDYPALTKRIASTLSQRLKASNNHAPHRRHAAKTFAVIPAGKAAATGAFIDKLLYALNQIGRACRISGSAVSAAMASGDLSERSVVNWLNEQEAQFDFLVYEADPHLSDWTFRCIRQADRLLAVTRFENDKSLNEIEAKLAAMSAHSPRSHPRMHLVLLHRDAAIAPNGTPDWLAGRPVERHHHVWTDSSAGYVRLARVLSGRAVGLVLGGGGARAFAHIGAIRALEEAGITIEAIGGTSLGALIAAQYAFGFTPTEMVDTNRLLFREFRPFKGDYTLPFYSFVSGKRTNKGLQNLFGKTHTSDLRIPFFCVSNNLSLAKVIVHRSDPVWKAVRCSMGLPGLMPPIIEHGQLIVDGGVLNNLPVDVMRDYGQGAVVAVDVSPPVDLLTDSEDRDHLGSFDFIRRKLFGRKGSLGVPLLAEILMRTAFLSSINHREEMSRQADLCIHPPMAGYGLLGWENLEKLVEVGYQVTRDRLKEWNDPAIVTARNRDAAKAREVNA
jgi:predicted acylesterase/phospholipase RssA/CRP-like cAMP-binding protein